MPFRVHYWVCGCCGEKFDSETDARKHEVGCFGEKEAQEKFEKERRGEEIHCPKCGMKLESSGMCCNSGEDSGYQCLCPKCGIMWVKTFDGRMIADEYLTAIAQRPQKMIDEG